MMPDLEFHGHRLFERDDWPQVTLIGTLLVLTAQSLLSAVLLAGYAVRVLRSGDDVDSAFPSFENLVALARDGAAAVAIVAAYHAPAAVAFAGTAHYARQQFVFLPGLSALTGSQAALTGSQAALTGPGDPGGSVASAPLIVVGLVVTVGLTVLAGYVGTAALLRYVEAGSIRAAFDPRAVRALAGSGAFLRTWLVAVGLLALVRFAAGLLTVVPVVGHVAAAATTFVATCGVLALTAATVPSVQTPRTSSRDVPDTRQTA